MKLAFALIIFTVIANNTAPKYLEKAEQTLPVQKVEALQEVKPPEPALVAPAPVVERPVAPKPVQIVGDKHSWLVASGIPESEWPAVDYIITRESGWNPNATNKSSGAHGLPQALPYSKTGCGWVDAVCQLQWADRYAKSRYGGWWGAKNFWVANHWW